MTEQYHYTHEDSFVNSIIGEGTTLRGEFELNGLLRIDGKFYGKVITNGKVLVGKNGIAECDIVAGTVVIGGKVKGEVIAIERITLLSTGELIGAVTTPRLVIEEGVIFDGTCEIIEDKDKLEKIKEKYLSENRLERRRPVGPAAEAAAEDGANTEPGSFQGIAEEQRRTVEKSKIT
jgi:cytoskeletal protein CcmA (bactofilin family)